MHCDWSSRVLYNSTRHAAYVWCVPYNSTYARKPSQSFLSLKILRRFFQTAIMAEEFPSFDLGFDFLNDQNNEEAGKSLKKFTSAYLFQIAREKSCDYLLIIYMKKFEMNKAWPNARNISTQHLATLLHDVATCVARGGQTHATFSSFSTQHVNVHVPQAPGAQEVDLTRMP